MLDKHFAAEDGEEGVVKHEKEVEEVFDRSDIGSEWDGIDVTSGGFDEGDVCGRRDVAAAEEGGGWGDYGFGRSDPAAGLAVFCDQPSRRETSVARRAMRRDPTAVVDREGVRHARH